MERCILLFPPFLPLHGLPSLDFPTLPLLTFALPCHCPFVLPYSFLLIFFRPFPYLLFPSGSLPILLSSLTFPSSSALSLPIYSNPFPLPFVLPFLSFSSPLILSMSFSSFLFPSLSLPCILFLGLPFLSISLPFTPHLLSLPVPCLSFHSFSFVYGFLFYLSIASTPIAYHGRKENVWSDARKEEENK